MRNQNTKQTSTETTVAQKLVLPQVRYHPSIQSPVGSSGAKTTKKTRAESPNVPHPGTDSQADSAAAVTAPPEGRHKREHTPVKQAAVTDAGPASKPPTPEQVPLDVGVCLDQRVVEEVEVLTRGQRNNPDWFTWRKNRITASVAHSIARSRFVNGKSKTPPSSYLAAVTGTPRPPPPDSLCIFTFCRLLFKQRDERGYHWSRSRSAEGTGICDTCDSSLQVRGPESRPEP